MAFTGNFMCTSFKVELLKGQHDFTNGQDQLLRSLCTTTMLRLPQRQQTTRLLTK